MAMERLKRRRKKRAPADLAKESRYLPNLLTMGRILTVPFILLFIDNYSPIRSFVACLIYLFASLTDYLDGWIARRRKQVSLLGKFLDPLADKLMVTSVLVYLTAMDRCPAWVVVALLARELAVTGLRTIAISEGLVISASDSGKQKTALQMIATMFLLLHFRYPVWGLENVFIKDEPLLIDFHAVGLYTLYLAVAMGWISGVDYFLGFARSVKAASTARAAAAAGKPAQAQDAHAGAQVDKATDKPASPSPDPAERKK